MRSAVLVFALGLITVLVHRLTAAAPLDARAGLALGALLVAAWLGAELARRARMPRVTGFLVLGFAIGPAWLSLVRPDEAEALNFITDASLAIVGLGAGAMVSRPAAGAERRAMLRLGAATIAFPFAAVALVAFTVIRWFPLTAHQSWGSAIGAALGLGIVAAVSSPTLTFAVLHEAHIPEDRPFGRSVLTVAVLKDVAGVLLLAATLAVIRPFGGGVQWLLLRVAGSLAAGVVLGALLERALVLRPASAPLALIGFAFMTALLPRVLPAGGALTALTAGVFIRNVRPAAREPLVAALDEIAVPLFGFAFVLLGASLRIDALDRLWPWALLFVGLRIMALRYGALWAGARESWLGLVSQGGVALLLAAAARYAFPAWGVSFEALVAAMVAVNALVGPMLWYRGLGRAGELEPLEDRAPLLPRPAAVLLLVLVALTPAALAAQFFVGDSAVRSVRSAALAGAGAALVGDAGAIFTNPAGIATLRSAALEGSYEHRAGGPTIASAAAALRLGRLDWGLGAETVDATSGGSGDVLAVSALVLRYGMLAIGSSAKYVERSAGGALLHSWGSDIGATLAVFDIAALGASVQNLSSDLGNGTHLRRATRLGLTMNYVDPQGSLRLLTTFEGLWPEGGAAALVVGVEGGITARKVGLIGRMGAAGGSVPGGGSPVTFGGGIELGALHVDYAFQSFNGPGGDRHRFGLRWAH